MFFPALPTMQLLDYCGHQNCLKKPESQVVAESEGWTPQQLAYYGVPDADQWVYAESNGESGS